MNNYLQIFFGCALGICLVIVVASELIRRGTKYELGFWDAMKVYFSRHTGPLVSAIIIVLIAMFLFPYIYTSSQIPEGSPGYNERYNQIVAGLRLYSIGLGIIAQGIGFVIVGKGDKFLRQLESEKKVNTETQKP